MYIIEVDKFFNQVANLKHSISLGLFSMVDNRRGASANNVTMEESHLMAQGSSPSIFAPPEQKLRSESLRQAGAKGGSGIGSSTLKNETISKKKAFALQDKVIFILQSMSLSINRWVVL